MLFKNLTGYALTPGHSLSYVNLLNESLAKFKYEPLGPHDLSTMGWVPSCPYDDSVLAHRVERFIILKLAIEKRTIPASVVARELGKEAKKFERDMGFHPRKKALKEIKERVIDLLTPRAFPITKYVSVIIDLTRDYLMIDTASSTVADDVIKALFKADDKFPVQLFRYEHSVTEQMASWLVHGVPWRFTYDEQVTLKQSSADKKVTYINMQTSDNTISDHIASGMIVDAMAMTFDDKISFVIDDTVTLTKIKPHDKLVTSFSADPNEFDANLLLSGSELSDLLQAVNALLGTESDGDLI